MLQGRRKFRVSGWSMPLNTARKSKSLSSPPTKPMDSIGLQFVHFIFDKNSLLWFSGHDQSQLVQACSDGESRNCWHGSSFAASTLNCVDFTHSEPSPGVYPSRQPTVRDHSWLRGIIGPQSSESTFCAGLSGPQLPGTYSCRLEAECLSCVGGNSGQVSTGRAGPRQSVTLDQATDAYWAPGGPQIRVRHCCKSQVDQHNCVCAICFASTRHARQCHHWQSRVAQASARQAR